jgi:hypothetical protein
MYEPEQHPEHGSLTGAVRAYQPIDLPDLHVEAEVVYGQNLVVAAPEASYRAVAKALA